MTSIALALALAAQSAPMQTTGQVSTGLTFSSWLMSGGRLVTTDSLHIGARGALYVDNEADGALELGIGATVQVTCNCL